MIIKCPFCDFIYINELFASNEDSSNNNIFYIRCSCKNSIMRKHNNLPSLFVIKNIEYNKEFFDFEYDFENNETQIEHVGHYLYEGPNRIFKFAYDDNKRKFFHLKNYDIRNISLEKLIKQIKLISLL